MDQATLPDDDVSLSPNDEQVPLSPPVGSDDSDAVPEDAAPTSVASPTRPKTRPALAVSSPSAAPPSKRQKPSSSSAGGMVQLPDLAPSGNAAVAVETKEISPTEFIRGMPNYFANIDPDKLTLSSRVFKGKTYLDFGYDGAHPVRVWTPFMRVQFAEMETYARPSRPPTGDQQDYRSVDPAKLAFNCRLTTAEAWCPEVADDDDCDKEGLAFCRWLNAVTLRAAELLYEHSQRADGKGVGDEVAAAVQQQISQIRAVVGDNDKEIDPLSMLSSDAIVGLPAQNRKRSKVDQATLRAQLQRPLTAQECQLDHTMGFVAKRRVWRFLADDRAHRLLQSGLGPKNAVDKRMWHEKRRFYDEPKFFRASRCATHKDATGAMLPEPPRTMSVPNDSVVSMCLQLTPRDIGGVVSKVTVARTIDSVMYLKMAPSSRHHALPSVPQVTQLVEVADADKEIPQLRSLTEDEEAELMRMVDAASDTHQSGGFAGNKDV